MTGTPPPPQPEPFEPFRVLRTERIYDSHWCGLRRDVIEVRGGAEQEYHVFEVSNAAVVVPILSDGRIVMVGQYRHPLGKTHWEIPAGRIGPGEEPAETVERELREESGCRAGRLIELPGFYPTNGISAHYAHAFCALDCEFVGEPELEDSEQIVVRAFQREQVEALLDAGLLEDGFTAITLMYYLRRFPQN